MIIFQQGILSPLDGATSCWFQGSTRIDKDKIIVEVDNIEPSLLLICNIR